MLVDVSRAWRGKDGVESSIGADDTQKNGCYSPVVVGPSGQRAEGLLCATLPLSLHIRSPSSSLSMFPADGNGVAFSRKDVSNPACSGVPLCWFPCSMRHEQDESN